MKTAFVLAGGGAAGAYQLGCLKAIYETTKIRPDFMTANSAGSLNATGLSYRGIAELECVWRSITRRQDIFGDRFFGWITPLFGAESLWTSKPLKKKLQCLMENHTAGIPYWVNYTNLQNGKLTRAHSSDSNFPEKVLASASIPIITEPVNGIFVDGGIRENTPLGFAIDQGADRIFVFLNSSKDENARLPFIKEFKGVREIAARTLNIMSDEMFWQDIEMVKNYNTEGKGRKIEIYWFAPEKQTIDTLDFKQDLISKAIAQGVSETVKTLQGLNL